MQSCRGYWRPHGCAREVLVMRPPRMDSGCLCVLPWTPSESPCWSPHTSQDSLPTTHTLIFFPEPGREALAPERHWEETARGC